MSLMGVLLEHLPYNMSLFMYYAYPYFFFLNLALLLILALRNKSLIEKVRRLLRNIPRGVYVILGIIVLIYIVLAVRAMNPLNTLINPPVQEVCQAINLYRYGMIVKFDRPQGLASLAWPVKLTIPSVDMTAIFSWIGIVFGALSVFMLFVTARYLTKRNLIPLIICLTYAISGYTLDYTTNFMSGITLSSFFMLVLFFLYASEGESFENSREILFCTILCIYLRREDIVMLIPLCVYYFIGFAKRRLQFRLIDTLLAIICLLPNVLLELSNNRQAWFSNFSIGGYELQPLLARLVGVYTNYAKILSPLFFGLLVIGIILFLIRKKYYPLSILISSIFVYVAFQLYQDLNLHYTFNYIPISLVIIAVGAVWVYESFRNRVWRALIISTIIFATISVEKAPFSSFPNDPYYIQQQIEMGDYLGNSSVLLYTEQCMEVTWGRFYSNYTAVSPYWKFEYNHYGIDEFLANDTFTRFEYLVYPLEYEPNRSILEAQLGLMLTEVGFGEGVAHLYRIDNISQMVELPK